MPKKSLIKWTPCIEIFEFLWAEVANIPGNAAWDPAATLNHLVLSRFMTALRIMGSQVPGGLEIPDPHTHPNPSFLQGLVILRVE